jgi:hypothetical protein
MKRRRGYARGGEVVPDRYGTISSMGGDPRGGPEHYYQRVAPSDQRKDDNGNTGKAKGGKVKKVLRR